ncbi:MAG: hypothetical protein ACK4YX_08170, partial [Rhabdaerophilum calidifontis]
FAHLDVELKPLIGLPETDRPVRDPKLAEIAGAVEATTIQARRAYRLTNRGRAILKEIELLAEEPAEGPLSAAPTEPARRS